MHAKLTIILSNANMGLSVKVILISVLGSNGIHVPTLYIQNTNYE